jgi:DNA polymerase V
MFALADCNNFYASCEAVFRPELADRPVIVLSNNDGCVIARNAQAKQLGIKMAVPVYTLKALIQQHEVVVCSSNFALYADMSNRVMDVLASFTPTLEMYSIDESFLDVSPIAPSERYLHAIRMRSTVRRYTGIPISIGVGPTKTLAKIANHAAKKLESGILVLDPHDQAYQGQQREQDSTTDALLDGLLDALVVEEIWGIGQRRGAWLRQHGIRTALEFKQADIAWLRRHLSVTVARTALELRGISCLPLSAMRARKQQICVSRSFGREVTTLVEMKEAVAHYAARAGERLRANGTLARALTVFVTTNGFRADRAQYHKSATVKLPRATAYTPEIIAQAHTLLAKIWKPGYSYHKAEVVLGDLVMDAYEQLELFAPPPPAPEDQRQARAVMAAVDQINGRFGRDTLRLAASGIERPWGMRQANRSPRYTTRWEELVRAR